MLDESPAPAATMMHLRSLAASLPAHIPSEVGE
jgi:hypothetical protein